MCTNLTEHDPTVTAWLQKFAAMQMIGVLVPTTDGRELLLTHYTRSEPELRLLLDKLRLELLAQPPPKITGSAAGSRSPTSEDPSGRPDKSITWGLCVPPVGEVGLTVSA